MKKIFILLTALLTGCTLTDTSHHSEIPADKLVQLKVPETIKHNNKTYRLKAERDLGTIARFVYFEGKETPNNWSSEIELLHDRNIENRDLTARAQLREKVYQNTGVEHFNLDKRDQVLYSFVIYPPTESQKNWQVNVARGEDVDGCGFVQYQYVLKVPKTQKLVNMGQVKLIGYLKKYAIDRELARLAKLDWHWQCALPLQTPKQQ